MGAALSAQTPSAISNRGYFSPVAVLGFLVAVISCRACRGCSGVSSTNKFLFFGKGHTEGNHVVSGCMSDSDSVAPLPTHHGSLYTSGKRVAFKREGEPRQSAGSGPSDSS